MEGGVKCDDPQRESYRIPYILGTSWYGKSLNKVHPYAAHSYSYSYSYSYIHTRSCFIYILYSKLFNFLDCLVLSFS